MAHGRMAYLLLINFEMANSSSKCNRHIKEYLKQLIERTSFSWVVDFKHFEQV